MGVQKTKNKNRTVKGKIPENRPDTKAHPIDGQFGLLFQTQANDHHVEETSLV
jgi:hypothetical protein